jgi:type I restriction enzyme R subunit
MSFNELNTVENFILYKLSGQNLNSDKEVLIHSTQSISENNSFPWVYKSASELDRSPEDVLVESELKSSILRINPLLTGKPELADEIIYKLRALLIQVNHVGLVKANEDFSLWLRGEKTMAFGPRNQHIPSHLIDFENSKNNSFFITNQYRVHARETKIPDIVLLINGIPVVVGEAKTIIRPSISWMDGAHEIHEIYENTIPQLFVPNIFSFATEGKELYYGSVRCPLEHWSPWRSNDSESSLSHAIGLKEIGKELQELFNPNLLLDVLQNFAIFSTDKRKKRIKVICRYQQYDATNQIVELAIRGA